MILNGFAASGLGKASEFTELGWVRGQLVDKLDLRPYPGTFNVRLIAPDDIQRWEALKLVPGIAIEEPAGGSCVAVCYPVLINESIRGAILIPGVVAYPPDQVEIVAPDSVRGTLGVKDGDPIALRLLD